MEKANDDDITNSNGYYNTDVGELGIEDSSDEEENYNLYECYDYNSMRGGDPEPSLK